MKITGNKMKRKEKYLSVRIVVSKYHRNGSKIDGTRTLNQIIFFFLQQNQNIFFSNIGNQNIFLEKKHNPPLQVKWSVPYGPLSIVKLYIMDKSSWRSVLLVVETGEKH
jgi:hypothetical protein